MAGDSVVGALRIVLGADTASFEDGMKGAGKTLEDFASKAKIAGTAIGVALSGAIIGLGVSLKNAVDQADKLGKLSQSMGVPVEQLSQMSLAAQLSGVSIEALAKSFSILNKNMVDASGNAKTEAARAFQAMGISVKDAGGNLKSAQQVIVEMAGKFQGYSDGAAKSALATATLGKSGAALVPMLNAGADGLKRMMDEADALGLTIDTKTAKAASQFNDNLNLMGKIWDGMVMKVTAALLPAFTQLTGAFLEIGRNGSLVANTTNLITSAIQGAITIAFTGVTVFERLGAEFVALVNLMKSDNLANTKVMWEEFVNEGKETGAALAGLGPKIKQFWDDASAAAARAALTVNKSVTPIIAGAKTGEEVIDSFLASQAKQSAKMQATAEGLTMTTAEAESYKVSLEAITLATEKNIPLTDALITKIQNAATSYGDIAEQTKLATLKFNELKQIGESVGGAIASSLSDAIKNGGKFLDVLKALGLKLLDIAFQAAVTKPLQNVFGNLFSGGKAPIFAASGADFVVPGSGGSDSVFTPMMLTPGERVQVSTKGDTRNGPGGGSTVYSPTYNFAPGMTGNDISVMKTLIAQSNRQTIADIQKLNRADSRALYR